MHWVCSQNRVKFGNTRGIPRVIINKLTLLVQYCHGCRLVCISTQWKSRMTATKIAVEKSSALCQLMKFIQPGFNITLHTTTHVHHSMICFMFHDVLIIYGPLSNPSMFLHVTSLQCCFTSLSMSIQNCSFSLVLFIFVH